MKPEELREMSPDEIRDKYSEKCVTCGKPLDSHPDERHDPTPAVDQASEPFENFSREERNIRNLLRAEKDCEAPILTGMGVTTVTIRGIRRREGVVEFGIAEDKASPIKYWIPATRFYHEWPD